jgi:hypothetical protein
MVWGSGIVRRIGAERVGLWRLIGGVLVEEGGALVSSCICESLKNGLILVK